MPCKASSAAHTSCVLRVSIMLAYFALKVADSTEIGSATAKMPISIVT